MCLVCVVCGVQEYTKLQAPVNVDKLTGHGGPDWLDYTNSSSMAAKLLKDQQDYASLDLGCGRACMVASCAGVFAVTTPALTVHVVQVPAC